MLKNAHLSYIRIILVTSILFLTGCKPRDLGMMGDHSAILHEDTAKMEILANAQELTAINDPHEAFFYCLKYRTGHLATKDVLKRIDLKTDFYVSARYNEDGELEVGNMLKYKLAVGGYFSTILHLAITFGEEETIKWIICENPFLITLKDGKDHNAIELLEKQGKKKIIAFLLDSMKDWRNYVLMFYTLIYAEEMHVRLPISEDLYAAVLHNTKPRDTILHAMAQYFDNNALNKLITILIAKTYDQESGVSYHELLRSCVMLNNKQGENFISICQKRGMQEVVDCINFVLAERKALETASQSLTKKNNNAEEYYEMRPLLELFEFLLSISGPKGSIEILSKKDCEGNTGLHLAIRSNKDTLKGLLAKCDPAGLSKLLSIKNNDGKKPLELFKNISELYDKNNKGETFLELIAKYVEPEVLIELTSGFGENEEEIKE